MQEDAQEQIKAEQEELARVKDEVASFKAMVLQLYRDQMAQVEKLPGEAKPAAPTVVVAPEQPEAPTAAPETPAEPAAAEQPAEQGESRYADLKFGETQKIRIGDTSHGLQ